MNRHKHNTRRATPESKTQVKPAPTVPSGDMPSTNALGGERHTELRTELEFGLALSTFLGGVWYLLFDVIDKLTLESPAEFLLYYFAYAQGIIFILFAYSLMLLFDMGLAISGRPILPRPAYDIFLYLWPISLLFLSLAYVVSKVSQDDPFLRSSTIAILLAAVVLGVVAYLKQLFLVCQTAIALVILVAGAMYYVPVMSWVMADVNITLDKEVYEPGDKAIVDIRTDGFVFNPILVDAEIDIFGTHDFRNSTEATLICNLDDTGTDYPLIKVRYETQIVGDQRVKYKKIRRAKIVLDGRKK